MSHISELIELTEVVLEWEWYSLTAFFFFLSDFPEEERELITPTHPSTLAQVFCPLGKLCPTTHPRLS